MYTPKRPPDRNRVPCVHSHTQLPDPPTMFSFCYACRDAWNGFTTIITWFSGAFGATKRRGASSGTLYA